MLHYGKSELLVGYIGQIDYTMGPYVCFKCSQRNVVVSSDIYFFSYIFNN